MKFLTYLYHQTGEPRAGLLRADGAYVLDLTRLLKAEVPISDIGALLERYEDPKASVSQTLKNGISDEFLVPLEDVELCAPILNPPTLRDASCFERHVVSAGINNGVGTPDIWYKAPLFYFQNTNCISGPEATIYRKNGSVSLDYEAEIAFVIGKRGKDISEEDAINHIFGFTIFNDWSDRDRCTFEVGFLGLHKGKDTAAGIGPYIVTTDELEDLIIDGRINLKVDAWVNNIHTTDSMTDDMFWSLPQLLAYISEDTEVVPGDIIGLGTVGTGCIYECPNMFSYLEDGDTVSIKAERLGTLRQYVGHREMQEIIKNHK